MHNFKNTTEFLILKFKTKETPFVDDVFYLMLIKKLLKHNNILFFTFKRPTFICGLISSL